MSWKQGPLPPNTWNWGGVVPVGEEGGGGFYFADFKGDTAEIVGDTLRVLKANEVAMYDNCLECPPSKSPAKGHRIGAAP